MAQWVGSVERLLKSGFLQIDVWPNFALKSMCFAGCTVAPCSCCCDSRSFVFSVFCLDLTSQHQLFYLATYGCCNLFTLILCVRKYNSIFDKVFTSLSMFFWSVLRMCIYIYTQYILYIYAIIYLSICVNVGFPPSYTWLKFCNEHPARYKCMFPERCLAATIFGWPRYGPRQLEGLLRDEEKKSCFSVAMLMMSHQIYPDMTRSCANGRMFDVQLPCYELNQWFVWGIFPRLWTGLRV